MKKLDNPKMSIGACDLTFFVNLPGGFLNEIHDRRLKQKLKNVYYHAL